MTSHVEFFTITDEGYFPGFVGLLNSLRMAGHTEPATVLDQGMSKPQKQIIRSHCRIVTLDYDVTNPCQLTAYPSQLNPDGVVVLIDSDALVLEHLGDIIDRARAGRICVSRDPDSSRFFNEWSDLFDLRAPLRKQTYYRSGLVIFSTNHWPHLLQRWWTCLSHIWHRPSFMEGASMRGDPCSQPDQDALNALLMSEVPPNSVFEMEPGWHVARDGFGKVTVSDPSQLTCRSRGKRVHVVDCSGSPKPWTYKSLLNKNHKPFFFLSLLKRSLAADDVPVQLPARFLPPWLWPCPVGDILCSLVEKWLNIRLLPPGFRQRLST